MRFPDWRADRVPALGDVISQTVGPDGDPSEVQRTYRIVGVEETATGYRILAERIEYGSLPESLDPDAMWTFYNLPRR